MFSVVVAFALAAAPVVEAVHDTDGTPGVRAVFDVDAPPDVVLDLLWDVSRFKTIFPDIKELHVEKRPDDSTVEVRFVVDAVVAKPTYTLRRKLDKATRTVSWVQIAGDLKKIVGFWKIAPHPVKGSVVTYQSIVDIGMPGSGLYRDAVMSKLNQMMDRVQTAAQKAQQK